MNEPQSDVRQVRSPSAPRFAAQPPSHVPPETLSDADLVVAIDSLHRKLRRARRSFLVAHTAGVSILVAVLCAGFAVLWAGPAPFFVRFLGHNHVTTTFDVLAWWLALLLLAILVAAFGEQLLRGKLRLVRGWRHRMHELDRRLADAKEVRRRRQTL